MRWRKPGFIFLLRRIRHKPSRRFPDFVTRMVFGEEYKSWSSTLCSFLQSHITVTFWGSVIFFSTLFSYRLSLYSSSNVRNYVPQKKKNFYHVPLYILFFIALNRNREDKRLWTNASMRHLNRSCSLFLQDLNLIY
jgi:hypothetical protein